MNSKRIQSSESYFLSWNHLCVCKSTIILSTVKLQIDIEGKIYFFSKNGKADTHSSLTWFIGERVFIYCNYIDKQMDIHTIRISKCHIDMHSLVCYFTRFICLWTSWCFSVKTLTSKEDVASRVDVLWICSIYKSLFRNKYSWNISNNEDNDYTMYNNNSRAVLCQILFYASEINNGNIVFHVSYLSHLLVTSIYLLKMSIKERKCGTNWWVSMRQLSTSNRAWEE